MINELIEQIGGRERLEYITLHEARFSHDTIIMARALLAVLDAKTVGYLFTGENGMAISPVDWQCDGMKMQGPLYLTPPAASVPDWLAYLTEEQVRLYISECESTIRTVSPMFLIHPIAKIALSALLSRRTLATPGGE